MNTIFLIVWMCAPNHPGCFMKQSAVEPITVIVDDMKQCEDRAKEFTKVIKDGKRVKHLCVKGAEL